MRGPAGGAGGAAAPRGSARGRAGPGSAGGRGAGTARAAGPRAALRTPAPGAAVPPAAGMRRPRRGAGQAAQRLSAPRHVRAPPRPAPSRRWQARPRAGTSGLERAQGRRGDEGKERALRGKQGEEREREILTSLGRQRPRSSRAAAPSHCPRDGAGGKCTITLAQRAALAPTPKARWRSAAPEQHPAASSRRCATGLREPPPPLRPAPPILLPPPIWGFSFSSRLPGRSGALRSLPRRREHGSGVPLTVPCWEPPAPPQGSGRPNLAPAAARCPGAAKPAGTRQVKRTPGSPPALNVLPAGWSGGRLGRQGRLRLENNKKRSDRFLQMAAGKRFLNTGAAPRAGGSRRRSSRAGRERGSVRPGRAFGRRAGLGWAGPASPPPPPPSASPRAPAPHGRYGSGRCRREQGTAPLGLRPPSVCVPGDPAGSLLFPKVWPPFRPLS
ncbi:uncharacterized protein LOC113460000 [Zonotrichia albicollis]|uniref:uncharacterized protein LOC113460000 n=1 Tax=Zonotrichia albicollis TaxID=44394 RepID=UPI003D810965